MAIPRWKLPLVSETHYDLARPTCGLKIPVFDSADAKESEKWNLWAEVHYKRLEELKGKLSGAAALNLTAEQWGNAHQNIDMTLAILKRMF